MPRLFALWNFLLRLSRQRWLRRLAACLALLWLLDGAIGLLTDAWWFEVLGLGALWRTRSWAWCGLFGVSLVVGWALSWWVLSPLSPRGTVELHIGDQSTLGRVLRVFARRSRRIARALMALFVGCLSWRLAAHGDQWLLFRAARSWGQVEPWTGLDVSFWVERLPFWEALHGASWTLLSLLLLIGGTLHLGQSLLAAVSPQDDRSVTRGRRRLWLIGAAWFALLALSYWFALLDEAMSWRGAPGEAVVPAGWDWLGWNWRRPLDVVGIVLSAMAAVGCWGASLWRGALNRRRMQRWRGAVCSFGLAAWFVPGLLHLFFTGPLWSVSVAPDEPHREAAFARAHLQATRRAWNLNAIASQTLPIVPLHPSTLDHLGIRRIAAVARLWDETLLPTAALNRDEDGHLTAISDWQTFDAARIQHGHPPLIRPSKSGLKRGSVAPTINPIPDDVDQSTLSGEIRLSNLFSRLLWAWRTRDAGLLWRSEQSTLRFRADPVERARAILPQAVAGGRPYALENGSILLDLLSASAQFPNAAPLDLSEQKVAWARDALKMVIAADGQTRFYEASPRDDDDPLRQTWRRAFPALIKPFASMPVAVQRQRRYPKRLFEAQSGLLENYGVSGGQESRWQVPSSGELSPEYALLPRRDGRPEFVLQGTLRAGDRLAALLHAACDGDDYGRLKLYRIEPEGAARLALPLSPENVERLAVDASRLGDSGASGAARGVKRLLIRGKVLMLPLPQRDQRFALLLIQALGSADDANAHQSTLQSTLMRDVRLESVAIADASTQNTGQAIVADDTGAALRGLKRPDARELARSALRLNQQAQAAMRSGDWARAGRLWQQQRGLLESLSHRNGN